MITIELTDAQAEVVQRVAANYGGIAKEAIALELRQAFPDCNWLNRKRAELAMAEGIVAVVWVARRQAVPA